MTKKKPIPAQCHLQVMLVDAQFAAITEPHQYKFTWTNLGENALQEEAGSTDSKGLTSIINTKGQVNVTVEITQPDGDKPETIVTTTKALTQKPVKRLQMSFSAQALTALKQTNKVETLTVREGKQQVQYVISRYTGNSSKISGLPYLVVDADTMEVITDLSRPSGKASALPATGRTEIINVDGIKKVGLVLGNSTDEASYWQKKANDVVLYKVAPKASGLTTVVITELAEIGDSYASESTVKDFKARLTGSVWAKFSRTYSLIDLGRILPGGLRISVASKDMVRRMYASGLMTKSQYDQFVSKQSAPKKPLEHRLEATIPWVDLLAPIYSDQIVFATGDFPVSARGGGHLFIPQIAFTIRLDDDFCKNANTITGLQPGAVLAKTHPYAYMALLEVSHSLNVTSAMLSSTWRPMYGSRLHKLGDALDITKIDVIDDALGEFAYNNRIEDSIAEKFTSGLKGHRYAKSGAIYYNFSASAGNMANHDDHLHFTADRLKLLAEQDQAPVQTPPKVADKPASKSIVTTPGQQPQSVPVRQLDIGDNPILWLQQQLGW